MKHQITLYCTWRTVHTPPLPWSHRGIVLAPSSGNRMQLSAARGARLGRAVVRKRDSVSTTTNSAPCTLLSHPLSTRCMLHNVRISRTRAEKLCPHYASVRSKGLDGSGKGRTEKRRKPSSKRVLYQIVTSHQTRSTMHRQSWLLPQQKQIPH